MEEGGKERRGGGRKRRKAGRKEGGRKDGRSNRKFEGNKHEVEYMYVNHDIYRHHNSSSEEHAN